MYAPSFILIALCASTSILAAPFRIPGFGSKMTSALARDAHHVADAVRIGQGSRQTVPNGVGYAILHKAANAKLPKGATPTMEYAKFRAQALIQRLRVRWLLYIFEIRPCTWNLNLACLHRQKPNLS